MRLSKLIPYPLIIVIVLSSCVFIHEKEVYKYFEIEKLPYIEKIVYSNKKVFNNVIIEINKDGYADIHILCVPFTAHEYEKNLSNRLKRDKSKSTQESITLEISGRKLRASRESLDHDNCYIICNDYFGGIALFLTYFGDCDTTKFLDDILSRIKYRISKEKVQKARSDFLYIMNLIERLDIPIYRSSNNIMHRYSLVSLGKIIKYDAEIEAYSTKILDFYKEYFSILDWKRLKMEEEKLGNWHNKKLFYRWIDKTGEMVARLILSQNNNKVGKLSKQSIYIDVTPYIVQEWGHRTL